ncbi:hypothetical protein CLF_103399 [Clonorchis sinensis]|uniref:Uncharacterized protein n=1 Tax=Clonorchis sinensis TaxID=79923 RepID=G7YNE8_CLOSI|nr:hypothetical protein CLF_103399 [Clonorchis sinensis]
MDGLRAASSRTNIVHSPEAVRLANTMREASESNWTSRFLIFVRGLPGSGKSTLDRCERWIVSGSRNSASIPKVNRTSILLHSNGRR